MGSLCCIFEIFSKFNTGEALNIFGGILIDVVNSGSGNSLQDQCIDCTTKTCLHFRRLFSMVLAAGIITRMMRKYIIDASCPIIM